MTWHKAPSIKAALDEATRRWPKRSKTLDGTIGDADHAARKSDHNPDQSGVVHAFDITHDPKHGVDCGKLAAHLIRMKDSRVKKIIWNRRTVDPPDWSWRPYHGEKPHTTHMHVSIKYNAKAENDTSDWWDFGAGYVTKGAHLMNEAHSAIASSQWKRAFEVLNGLKMEHLLEVLDSVDVSKVAAQRNTHAGAVNMPRLEFAMYVVEHRAVPSNAMMVVPYDQFLVAQRFLTKSAPAKGQTKVDLWTGRPWPRGSNRPIPPTYKRLTQVSVKIRQKSDELLGSNYPIGTHIVTTIDGQQLLFAVEWHKHPPTDNVSAALKDWHRGISACGKK